MKEYLDLTRGFLDLVLLLPRSDTEFWIKAVAACCIGGALLNAIAGIFRLGQPSFGPSVLIVILSTGIMVAAMAGMHLVIGDFFKGQAPWVGHALAGLLASALLIAPFIRMLWRGTYGSALMAWLISLAGILLVMTMIGAMFTAVGAGKNVVRKENDRNAVTRELLRSSP